MHHRERCLSPGAAAGEFFFFFILILPLEIRVGLPSSNNEFLLHRESDAMGQNFPQSVTAAFSSFLRPVSVFPAVSSTTGSTKSEQTPLCSWRLCAPCKCCPTEGTTEVFAGLGQPSAPSQPDAECPSSAPAASARKLCCRVPLPLPLAKGQGTNLPSAFWGPFCWAKGWTQ